VTSLCVAALIRGERPPVDIAPLDLGRFSNTTPAQHNNARKSDA